MAKLKIVKMGDDTLRRVCRPVEKITPRTLTLLDDMIETMRDANGCGLAGVQVGVLRRIVVIETEEGLFELIIISYFFIFTESLCNSYCHNRVICEKALRSEEGEILAFMVIKFKS